MSIASVVTGGTGGATRLHQSSQNATQVIPGVRGAVSGVIGVPAVVVVAVVVTGVVVASVRAHPVAVRGYGDVWSVLECVAAAAGEGVRPVAEVGQVTPTPSRCFAMVVVAVVVRECGGGGGECGG